MWSKSVELFNPYEAMMENKCEECQENTTKNIVFTSGTNIYDFFILPTIRYSDNGYIAFLTIEWLKWFIGIQLFVK